MRAEENLLRTQFGAEYDTYRACTSRLIPGVYQEEFFLSSLIAYHVRMAALLQGLVLCCGRSYVSGVRLLPTPIVPAK